MPTVRVRDLNLYVETHGVGRPIVLLHQDGMSSETWTPLVKYLAHDFHVVTWDRPGHGRSSDPPESPAYTVEGGAELLADLIERLGLQRPILFGASGGALIALAYVLQYPERTPLLILAEPPLHGLEREFPIDQCGYSAAAFSKIYAEQGIEATARAFMGTMFTEQRVDQILRSAAGRALTQLAPFVLLQSLHANEVFAPGGRLKEVRCPTIVLTGEKSNAFFKTVERVLASELPHCMPIRLPATDHANLLAPTPQMVRAIRAVADSVSSADVSLHLASGMSRIAAKDFPAPIDVRLTVPFSGRVVDRPVIDISASGFAVKLEPDDQVSPGMVVSHLALELPKGTARGRGTIRWVGPDRRAGIEINRMPILDRAILRDFVEDLGQPTLRPAEPSDLDDVVSVLDAAGGLDAEGAAAPVGVESFRALREALLAEPEQLALLVVRSRAAMEGTGELILEHGATWILHHIGVLPTSRLTTQELVAQLIEAAEPLKNLEHVRALVRIERVSGHARLHSMETTPALNWRTWRELCATSELADPGVSARPLSAGDVDVVDAALRAWFSPLEIAAMDLRASSYASNARVARTARRRHARVVVDDGKLAAIALFDGGVVGQSLGARWVIRLVPAGFSDVNIEALRGLARDALRGGDHAHEGLCLLAPPAYVTGSRHEGMALGSYWLEIVAHRDAALQLTNVLAVLRGATT